VAVGASFGALDRLGLSENELRGRLDLAPEMEKSDFTRSILARDVKGCKDYLDNMINGQPRRIDEFEKQVRILQTTVR